MGWRLADLVTLHGEKESIRGATFYLSWLGLNVAFERVETAAEVQAALERQPWDFIICDYDLPAPLSPQRVRCQASVVTSQVAGVR